MTHGGKREGSGAKPRDGVKRVMISVRVKPSTIQWLHDNSTQGIGALLDSIAEGEL